MTIDAVEERAMMAERDACVIGLVIAPVNPNANEARKIADESRSTFWFRTNYA